MPRRSFSPSSEAAQNAVATELPASQSVTAADASARVQQSIRRRRRAHPCRNQVVIDRDAASIVYQVVDNRTSQVVKQFPEEAVLRRRAYFHALDLTKDAPTRLRATDRSGLSSIKLPAFISVLVLRRRPVSR